MSAWLSVGSSSSKADLTATSSTNFLRSIYGSQVSQLPISDSNFDEDTSDEDDLWPQVCFSTPQLNMTRRPRSAAITQISTPQSNWQNQNESISHHSQHSKLTTHSLRSSSSSTNLKIRQNRSFPLRPKTASAVGRTVKPIRKRDSVHSHSSSSRPRSAYPTTLHHESSGNVRVSLNRPRTASVMKSTSQTQLVSVPVQNSTTPVALSSIPQYFDFWNEKPLKPREWTKVTHPRTKWKRPQSSSAGSLNRRAGKTGAERNRSGNLTDINGGDSNCNEQMNSNGRDDSLNYHAVGLTDDSTSNNLEGDKQDSMLAKTDLEDSHNIADDSNHTRDDKNSLVTSQDCSNNQNDTGTGTSNADRGDAHDDSLTQLNKVRDVLGNDQWNGVDSDDYFKKQNLSNKTASSWLNCGISSSSMITRFNLPVDLKTLENMTPFDYLRAHCIISEQRNSHYSKVFAKCCQSRHYCLSQKKEVIKALINALYKLLPVENAEAVCELVQLPSSDISVDKRTFECICAVAERVYGKFFLPEGLYKDVIEIVDFEALQWKLRDCHLQKELYTLLFTLSEEEKQ